jgi:hypothetical protein
MESIVINSSHLIDTTRNNRFQYRFANPIQFQNGDTIALGGLQMYYSTPNITEVYGNNVIQYRWIDNTVYTITIPDGLYSISDLNSYCKRAQLANNHYLESDTDQTFYLTLEVNTTYYSIQLNASAVPTQDDASVAGLSKPDDATWSFPTVNAKTPQWVIPDSSSITDVLGFYSGSYPSSTQSTDYQVTSDYTPQVHPVSSFLLHVNILKNNIAIPPSVLYSFSSDVSFGELLQVKPSEYAFLSIQPGNFSTLDVFFTDQNFDPVVIKDPSMVITLFVKRASV